MSTPAPGERPPPAPPVDPLLVDLPLAIDTARLRLRPFRADDAAALHEALRESIVQLREHLWFLPWVAEEPTLASAQVRCRRAEAAFLLRADLPYLAFERATGRLVGSVGLHRTDWALPRTEVGYWIRSGDTGRGFASEGVAALTDWALTALKAVRVELVTDERNRGSRAVAERTGYVLEGIVRNAARSPDGVLRHHCLYARLPPAG